MRIFAKIRIRAWCSRITVIAAAVAMMALMTAAVGCEADEPTAAPPTATAVMPSPTPTQESTATSMTNATATPPKPAALPSPEPTPTSTPGSNRLLPQFEGAWDAYTVEGRWWQEVEGFESSGGFLGFGPEFEVTAILKSCGLPQPRAIDSIPMVELRDLALCLINNDRADYDLPPVVLGSNPSAQMHAEDMIVNQTYGHWWADGYKPYMVYSATGGTSYINENIGSSGWTDQNWTTMGCADSSITCDVPSPAKSIIEKQFSFMYQDAHAYWGHRDNILDPGHRAVNIGIASDDKKVYVVQHFEGGMVEARGRPTLTSSGELSFAMDKKESGISIWENVVYVYHDPPPETMAFQGERLTSYCIGGGTSTDCPPPIASIYAPPKPGYRFSNLDPNEIVASSWLDIDARFSFAADMNTLLDDPGVYTLAIWNASDELMIALTILIEGREMEQLALRPTAIPTPEARPARTPWPTSTPTSTPLPSSSPTPTYPPHPSTYCAEWEEMVLNWIREGNVYPHGDVPIHPNLSVEDTNYYCNLEFPIIYIDVYDEAEVGYGYYRSGSWRKPQLLPGQYQYFTYDGDDRVEGLSCALITNKTENQHTRIPMARGETFVYRLGTHHGEVSLAVTDAEGRQQCFGVLVRIGD